MQPEAATHDGWVPPNCSISYIADGGSETMEVVPAVPEGEGFHPLIPKVARLVWTSC